MRWEPVPADLSVYLPSLEDALLGLLGRPEGEQAGTETRELIGGRR